MLRPTLSPLALAWLLVFAGGCASSHKHAEVPDFTEKGWSPAANQSDQAKADTPIQPTVDNVSKGEDAAKVAPPDAPVAVAATKPIATAGTDSDVVSGAALPPAPPMQKGVKAKGKRSGKKRKGAKST